MAVRLDFALNHQRLLRQVGLLAAEVFDFILVLLAEVIKPQAVAFRIHDLAELILQAPALRRVQQALEHGVLYPLAVVDALLRNLPQAPAADCEAVRQLRPAGTGLRVRVPAGHGAVPEPAE